MYTKQDKIFEIIGHIILLSLTACVLIPLFLMVMSSFTDNNELVVNGYSFFPEKFSLYAYEYVFETGNAVISAYGVSIVLTLVGTILSLVVTTLLGYALSKPKLPGRNLLSFYVLFTMLFNGGLVPTYINYTNVFGIKNTFLALLIPNLVTNGFNIFLMRSYFVTSIPDEILEASIIDGASEFQTLFHVALPLAKPIVATVGLFAGIGYWNDWQNGYIYLTKRTDLFSIQNLLNRMILNIQFLTQNAADVKNAQFALSELPSVSIRMAIAVLGVLPIIIIYPFVQKYFVKGITLGGVKG